MADGATIFAVASGAGLAAITVVRVSGPGCPGILDGLAHQRPPARVASLRTLRNRSGELLDRAVVLWFPAPRSYTGEDCIEFQLHGGRAVLAAVSEALVREGARPAIPASSPGAPSSTAGSTCCRPRRSRILWPPRPRPSAGRRWRRWRADSAGFTTAGPRG